MIQCQRCGIPVADPRTMQGGRCIPCDRVAALWELLFGVLAGGVGLVFIAIVLWVWSSTSFEPKVQPKRVVDQSIASTEPAR